MKKIYYTEEIYNLVIALRKKNLSAKEIIDTCKQKYNINLNRGIEHWIYGKTKPWSIKRPLKRGYEKLTPEKAYILGVLCGDGCITYDKPRIILGNTSKEFIEEFINCVRKHYGLKPSIYFVPKEKIKVSIVKNPPHAIKAKKDQMHVTFYGRNLIEDLRKYGDFRTNNWRVPKQIINCKNKKIICFFLKGLYDSEGSSSYHVNLSSNSIDGLKGVQILLKKLGIESTVFKSKTCFVLSIHNQKNKRLFKEYINFRISSRLHQLKRTLASYKTRKSYSKKFVNMLIPKILQLRREGFSSREIAKKLSIGKSTVLRKLHKFAKL